MQWEQVASRYNVWENCTFFALTLGWKVSLHCLMFDIHVSFHSACIEKYQFTVGAGIAEQWDVESAQFQKSDKLREVMSSETGNLVQFMFHTKFLFECDKYRYIRGEIQMYFTPDFRLIVTNTRLCNLHPVYQNHLSRFVQAKICLLLPFSWFMRPSNMARKHQICCRQYSDEK